MILDVNRTTIRAKNLYRGNNLFVVVSLAFIQDYKWVCWTKGFEFHNEFNEDDAITNFRTDT